MADQNALRQFIQTNLYGNLLGRDPLQTNDASGLDYWTNEAAKQGWTNDQLTDAFAQSAGTTLQQNTESQRKALAPTLWSAMQAQSSNADLAPSMGDAPMYSAYESQPFNFEADPGYEFRRQQGEKAIQARQLASGNFFSGGAMKELADYGQNLASQEYQNAFSRYLSQDDNSFRNHQANFSGDYNRWKDLNSTAYSRSIAEDERDYSRWVDAYGRDRDADATNWDRLTYLDKTGLSAAGGTVSAGNSTSGNISSLNSAAGTASANGKIGSSNAWSNALQNLIYQSRK
jgi:hypothetical protein